jgi:hypothetical protein
MYSNFACQVRKVFFSPFPRTLIEASACFPELRLRLQVLFNRSSRLAEVALPA